MGLFEPLHRLAEVDDQQGVSNSGSRGRGGRLMWTTIDPVIFAEAPEATLAKRGAFAPSESEAWMKCIDRLLAIRSLEDDWDGQGTPAPGQRLVESAIILAALLRQGGLRAPDHTVQTPAEGVVFDWWGLNHSLFEIEVSEPYVAHVFRSADDVAPTHRMIRGVEGQLAPRQAVGA